jgi:DNA/RNA-binding domain of Phe-tRNA-synthetase-like protein
MLITVTDAWKSEYPTAHVGVLAMRNVENPRHHSELEALKRDFEKTIRTRYDHYTKADLAALPTMVCYQRYYKRFRKTYHVLLQLRSVVLENKHLPSVAALVEASFVAELNSGLLTAAHDLDKVRSPILLDVARDDEGYTLLNGRTQTLKPTDMVMRDASDIICSVIYGLDNRTAITPSTRRVLFVVYAPDGISTDAIRAHLEEIRGYAQIIAPQSESVELSVYSASH